MSKRVWFAAAGSLVAAAGVLGVAASGCSSSNTQSTTGGGGSSGTSAAGDGGVKTGDATTATTTCTAENNIFEVVFSPGYTQVIPNDTTHTFSIPAIVAGVDLSKVVWSASSNAVTLAADPTTGGVLITANPSSPGASSTQTVTIYAVAGGSCGEGTLIINPTTEAAWSAGEARYNDNVALPTGPGGAKDLFDPPDGGNRYACIDCHAPHGEDGGLGIQFNDVAHTPEQTGGFSDQQLLEIVTQGIVPGYSTDAATAADAGYFDTTIVSYAEWHRFHHWNFVDAEAPGIVTYLRALTPAAQTGTSTANFGGFGGGGPPPDGGYKIPDGGFHHHHDGGAPPPPPADGG